MTEHETFEALTDALNKASTAALALSRLRPDQARQWEKMAEAYQVACEAVWRLAGDGTLRTKQ
jgi:hypothetical protein